MTYSLDTEQTDEGITCVDPQTGKLFTLIKPFMFEGNHEGWSVNIDMLQIRITHTYKSLQAAEYRVLAEFVEWKETR